MCKGLQGKYVEHLDLKVTMTNARASASDLPRRRRKGEYVVSSELRKKTGLLSLNRMRVFAVHGCKCDICGREGTEVIHTVDNGGGHHVDLYAVEDNRYILMNRDHILPASKGGPNHLWNLRPMCEPCNSKRGNTYTDEDKALYERRLRWAQFGNKLFRHVPFLSDGMIYRASMILAKLFPSNHTTK